MSDININLNNKNKKSIIIFILISVVTVLIVSIVYLLTRNIIENNKNNHQKSVLENLLNKSSIIYNNQILSSVVYVENKKYLNSVNYSPIYIAKENNNITAIIIETIAPDGYNGNINILVAIKPEFKNIANSKIINIAITNHEETPGLGDKADEDKYPTKAKFWLDQFKNKSLDNPTDPNKWAVKKDNNDAIIDSWTGATITPRAITKAVYKSLIFFELYSKQIINTKYKSKLKIK